MKDDQEECNGCETCGELCPVDVFEMKDEKCLVINSDECLVCRAWGVQCPNAVIEIIEWNREIMNP